ncbi:signal recognition particle protein, partial [Campylobacter coli]
KVLNPDEIFYVADAMSGQDGVKTASSFNELLGITGVILSKFDADTKGGIALGITKQIGIPLRFVGVGEKIADLEIFIPERIVNRIMGEGDLATLAEKTAAIIDEKEAKKLNQKIKKGEFNFNDFLTQMESVKKLGSMKSIIGMIPGLSNVASSVKDLDLDNSKEIIHIKAMISSMTPKERENPDLLNNARKRRIAEGAGLSQVEVNRFLKQFANAAKLAKRFSGKKGMDSLMQMMNQARRQF